MGMKAMLHGLGPDRNHPPGGRSQPLPQPGSRRAVRRWIGGLAAWIVCGGIGITGGLWSGSCQADEAAAVESFKSFLESPPVVRSLAFGIRDQVRPIGGEVYYDARSGKLRMVDSPEIATHPRPGLDDEGFRWYWARWQPGAFVLRQLIPDEGGDSEGKQPSGLHSFGRYGETYWAHRGGNLQTHDSGDDASGAPVRNLVRLWEGMLARVLNLGAHDLAVGVIRWQGDQFQHQSAMGNIPIGGRLRTEAGKVAGLDLQHDNQHNYRVEYQYVEGTEPDWLPRKYVRSYLAPSGPEVRAEVRIRHVEFSDHPLELSWFRQELDETPALSDIGPFTPHSRVTERWDYTRDGIVARNESGDVRQVQQLTSEQRLELYRSMASPRRSGWLFAFALAVLLLPPLLVFLGRRGFGTSIK